MPMFQNHLDSDRSETAIPLESPIQHVTLYSDRVLLSGCKKATHWYTYCEILRYFGNIYKDSVRIDVKGGQIYRLEKERIERSDFDLEELQNMIVKIEKFKIKRKVFWRKK